MPAGPSTTTLRPDPARAAAIAASMQPKLALALEEQVDPGKRRGAHGVERTAGTERRRSRTFQP